MRLSKVLTALSSRLALDEERKDAALYKYQTFYHRGREQQGKLLWYALLLQFCNDRRDEKVSIKRAAHLKAEEEKIF
jgi:hypothetical protein